MKNDNIDNELKMCQGILKKFEESLEDCKKDYAFLQTQKVEYGETEEHQKAVEAFKERSSGIQVTMTLLNKRIEKLNEKKNN